MRIVLCGGLSISLSLLSACSNSTEALQQKIISAVEQKRGNRDRVVVNLKSLTAFRWDRFYAFGPYTHPEQINKTLGFYWSGAWSTGSEHQDLFDVLVFVRDQEVVAHVRYPREHGDFYRVSRTNGYSADEAIFEIRVESHGIPILVPYERAASDGS
jgi:hypothetical protein